jgi:MED7 protein
MSSTIDSNGNGQVAENSSSSNSNNSNCATTTNSTSGGGGRVVEQDIDDVPGEATLLVSEFPPPPYYYARALQNYRTSGEGSTESATSAVGGATSTLSKAFSSYPLLPPEIPIDALSRGTRRAAAAAARARIEAERLRLIEMGYTTSDERTGAILGSGSSTIGANSGGGPSGGGGIMDDNSQEEEGDVVAVFGEIVEDPIQVTPIDVCEDPKIVRTELKRLNRKVVQGFVQLVQDLVHRPIDNKKTRDELSHNIFLMLQECNKFRDHQAREILIELLEKQLRHRKLLIKELRDVISQADDLLHTTTTTTSDLSSLSAK